MLQQCYIFHVRSLSSISVHIELSPQGFLNTDYTSCSFKVITPGQLGNMTELEEGGASTNSDHVNTGLDGKLRSPGSVESCPRRCRVYGTFSAV